jgi:hypothetical protein
MKITLSTQQAVDILMADKNANWSLGAAVAIVSYYQEWEKNEQQEYELDPTSERGAWNEYKTAQEAAADYNFFGDDEECLEWLRENIDVLEFEGGVLTGVM